jgi:hypothetical protein
MFSVWWPYSRQSADSVCAAGDLGRRVDRNGVTDCDSVCNPQQNQMAERGIVLSSTYLFIIIFFFLLLFFYSETISLLLFSYSFFCSCSHISEHFVQAMLAEERIRVWGGNVELPQTQETGPIENIAAPDSINGTKWKHWRTCLIGN